MTCIATQVLPLLSLSHCTLQVAGLTYNRLLIPTLHKPFYLVLCFRTPYWLAVPYRLIQHQSTQKNIPIFEGEHMRIITIGTNHRVVFIVFTYHIPITVLYRSVSVRLFICSCVISKSFILHSPQQYGFSAISQYGQFWHLGGI